MRDGEHNGLVDEMRSAGHNGGAQGQDNEGSNDLSNGLKFQESNTGRQRGGDQSSPRENAVNGWRITRQIKK